MRKAIETLPVNISVVIDHRMVWAIGVTMALFRLVH